MNEIGAITCLIEPDLGTVTTLEHVPFLSTFFQLSSASLFFLSFFIRFSFYVVMSETTTSPSVQLHQISPSSSMSSNDSAPVSEPTSDEQPDLGAFGAVLREYHHLQPIHRVPVYIRPPSSSMASTFHADQSVAGGDELRSRSLRSRTSRNSARSGLSGLSSFTRPTSSSDRPEGSTVWTHYAIAPYLMSQTPVSEEDDSYGGSRQGSDQDSRFDFARPHSHASISTESGRTVEIVSEHDDPSYEEGSQNPPESSPHPSFESEPAVLVPVSHNDTRLNSRATVGVEDDSDLVLSVIHIEEGTEDSSATSRENLAAMRRDQLSALSFAFSSTVDRSSDQTSTMQLHSQTRPVTTTVASSSSSSSRPSASLGSDATQIPSSLPILTPSASTTSDVQTGSSSSSTTQYNHTFNSQHIASRNDVGLLYTSTASSASSKLSLVSYQIPETPPMNVVEESDTGPDAPAVAPRLQARGNYGGSHTSTSSISSTSERSSESVSLKTQRSITSSSMSNATPTYHTVPSHPTGTQQPSPLPQSHSGPQDDAASFSSVGLSTIRSLIFSDPASNQGERMPTSTIVPLSDADRYRPPSSGISSLFYEGSRHSGFLDEPIDDEDEVIARPLVILGQDDSAQTGTFSFFPPLIDSEEPNQNRSNKLARTEDFLQTTKPNQPTRHTMHTLLVKDSFIHLAASHRPLRPGIYCITLNHNHPKCPSPRHHAVAPLLSSRLLSQTCINKRRMRNEICIPVHRVQLHRSKYWEGPHCRSLTFREDIIMEWATPIRYWVFTYFRQRSRRPTLKTFLIYAVMGI